MNSAIERLLGLRVGDIMNRDVVLISAAASMEEAARTLADHDITGAPVVNAAGQCIGVLSVTDLAMRETRMADLGETIAWGLDAMYSKKTAGDVLPPDIAPDEIVEDHMSPVVQTIDVSATILNAARVLCREHIHRLIIVDDQRRPVGVVSALDLVATMIGAVEE